MQKQKLKNMRREFRRIGRLYHPRRVGRLYHPSRIGKLAHVEKKHGSQD